MEQAERVLACVDRSHFADFVVDHAAWAARQLQAPLELLHVIDRHPERATGGDHSGAIGVDAQASLLTQLASEDEARVRAVRDAGRVFLKRLRERALASGVESTDVKQRHGELEETLVEQERGVSLFVLGRRGASAEVTQRDLGRNVERVVRALQRPILTVTEDYREPRRVLVAFDGRGPSRRGVELAATSPLCSGLEVHVLMSGRPRRDAQRQLAWAETVLDKAGISAVCDLLPGDAEDTIARAIRDRAIDLLVMGAYSHSPLRGLFLGSRTSDLLRAARIPTLLLR